jgi:hypothetical protein
LARSAATRIAPDRKDPIRPEPASLSWVVTKAARRLVRALGPNALDVMTQRLDERTHSCSLLADGDGVSGFATVC